MLLDDLAAAVVGAELGDLPALARIHQAMEELRDTGGLPEATAASLSDGMHRIEQIVTGDCADPNATLADVARMVTELQKLCESGTPAGDAAWNLGVTPPTGSSAAEAPVAEAPSVEPATTETPSTRTAPESTTVSATPSATPPPAPVAPSTNDALSSDPALLAEFVTESREHLENAEAALLDLETNPQNTEGINLIFRSFHTIKGTSGFLELVRINRVAHKAETLLDRARKGEITLAGGYADLALEATDLLKQLVECVRPGADASNAPPPELVDAFIARLEAPDMPAAAVVPTLRVGDILVGRGQAERNEVELVAGQPGAGPIGVKLTRAGVVEPREVADALRTQRQVNTAAEADATLRVSMARLDKLIDTVGELVIAQSMVSQDTIVRNSGTQGLARKVAQSDKITRELQDLTLSMRMVPLKGTFQKMARLVRDVAKKANKQVRFITEGEETEIDRNMVDAISDPLVHMMRNAADHGVETPEDRLRAGKPAEGTIVLRASHAAGKVVIEVLDDGKGIDPEKILAKAIERKIVEPGRELSQNEIYDLLFAPGFSTAEKLTDVSGRGVGMDVVKRNIESLRGRVEVASVKGQGSTFTIRLPLTLAIIDGMLLKVGAETYVLPTANIEQALRPPPGSVSTVKGQGEMLLLRGQLVPIFRLHRLLGVPGAFESLNDALLVVVEHEGQRCALLADTLLAQQQVVIKSLSSALGEVEGVSGAAILGNGRVGLILDVGGIIRAARGTASEAA